MPRSLTFAIVVLGLVACREPSSPLPTSDPTSLRHPPAGDVVGFVGDYGAHAWLGIPYALPPEGDRRWRAPARAPRWDGTREALAFGSPCPQFASRFAGVAGPEGSVQGSEDCLYLNVYAPRAASADAAATARHPVMLWIHGGGNVVGHAGVYDGGNLAATHDVVVVTTNYRLGPFGWFRHAALRDEQTTPEEASGNFGTLDLIRALTWVRDNIAAFGGDPGNVTIFGESAGGRNVLSLLVAPPAAGLFHRAIVQSGRATLGDPSAAESTTDDAFRGPGSGAIVQRILINRHEARGPDEAVTRLRAMKQSEIAGRLRWTSAGDLLGLYAARPDVAMIAVPQLFADGRVLPADSVLDRLRSGRWNRVPVLIGTNRDEQKLFLFTKDEWIRRSFWVIPKARDPEGYDLHADYLSRLWKAMGADEPVAAIRAGGHADVWLYRFDWDEEPTVFGAELSHLLGAAHGFEIPFVFGHWDLGREANRMFTSDNAPGRAALASAMMSAWSSFAATGVPDDWERAPTLTVLDTPLGGGIRRESNPLLTQEAVIESAAADSRIRGPGERCKLLGALVDTADRVDRDALPRLADPGCH